MGAAGNGNLRVQWSPPNRTLAVVWMSLHSQAWVAFDDADRNAADRTRPCPCRGARCADERPRMWSIHRRTEEIAGVRLYV
jgi:hypothetical protein